MNMLVLSDIHGNLVALDAVVAEPHDVVVCLGDLVGYGPEPAACVRWLTRSRRSGGRSSRERSARTSLASLAQRSAKSMKFDTSSYPCHTHRSALPPSRPGPAAWDSEVKFLDVDVVFVGHTHLQFELMVAGKHVINPAAWANRRTAISGRRTPWWRRASSGSRVGRTMSSGRWPVSRLLGRTPKPWPI